MTIGIVGGVERDRVKYERIAAAHGHAVEYHPGHAGGRGTERLRQMVARVDLVLVATDVNSHQGVILARAAAAAIGRRCIIMRRCSVSSFIRLLESEGA